MKLNWDSLLEPIFLFILSLIAGTLWVIVPIQSKPLPNAVPPAQVVSAPTVEPAPSIVKTAPRKPAPEPDPLAQNRALLAKTEQQVQTERAAVDRNLKLVSDEQQRAFVAIQKEQQRIEEFRNGLGALNRKQSELRAEAERNAEAGRVEVQLQAKKAELAKLETELRNTRNPFEKEVISLPRASPANKLPILVELFHNRAIPVDKNHFHFTSPKWSGPRVATRTGPGESAEEISNPDSAFRKFLDGIKTDKQYLACLLNPDSFDVFREVRRIAREKGVALGWEPIDSSGGKITIYPVHFVKDAGKPRSEKEKNLPRVTAIIE